MGPIFVKTVREASRDSRLLLLALLFLVLTGASIATSVAQSARYEAERSEAARSERTVWLGQGDVNPHTAAHFGQFAFKPRGVMAAFDPGLTPWLGEAVWIEAHYQNPPQARPAENELLLQRFGDLSPAWVLQTLLPLVIILAGFGAIAMDRENGTLRLQRIQGVTTTRLVAGKFLALATLGTLVVIAVIATVTLLVAWDGGWSSDLGVRAVGAAALYSIYIILIASVTVAASAFVESARGALVALLACWIIGVVLAPRLAAEQASQTHPTLAAGDFWSEVLRLRAEGIDGHDPSDARTQVLLERTLAEYDVSSVQDLPIDFSGIALQADEEYGNQVFDRLYGEEAAREDAQADVQRLYSIMSPLIAVRSLSMGLAGVDLAHHRGFVRSAELHRRDVQRVLNGEQARHGRGQNFNNTVGAEFWAAMPEFSHAPPSFRDIGGRYALDVLIVALWLAAALLLLLASARRVEKTL